MDLRSLKYFNMRKAGLWSQDLSVDGPSPYSRNPRNNGQSTPPNSGIGRLGGTARLSTWSLWWPRPDGISSKALPTPKFLADANFSASCRPTIHSPPHTLHSIHAPTASNLSRIASIKNKLIELRAASQPQSSGPVSCGVKGAHVGKPIRPQSRSAR